MQDQTPETFQILLFSQPSDLKEPWICPSGKPKWNMALKLGRKSPGVFKLCAFILFNFILVGRSYFILPSQNDQDTSDIGSPDKIDFPGGSDGKACVYNVGELSSIPGSGSSLQKEKATHSSTLAQKIPWTEEPGVHGVAKSWTRLNDFTFTFFHFDKI